MTVSFLTSKQQWKLLTVSWFSFGLCGHFNKKIRGDCPPCAREQLGFQSLTRPYLQSRGCQGPYR